MSLTKEELLEQNPWKSIANSKHYALYSNDFEMVADCDKDCILNYNIKCKNNDFKFILSINPEPFVGNILNNPAVVILSLNPGYISGLNNNFPLLLNDEEYAKLLEIKRNDLLLRGDAILHPDNKAENILDGFYWQKCLAELLKESHFAENDFYRKFGLLQYIGYTSQNFGGFNQTLESQQFTSKVIEYLIENTKCVFVASRAKWNNGNSIISKSQIDVLKSNCRWFETRNNRCQHLSKCNLDGSQENAVQFNHILDSLR